MTKILKQKEVPGGTSWMVAPTGPDSGVAEMVSHQQYPPRVLVDSNKLMSILVFAVLATIVVVSGGSAWMVLATAVASRVATSDAKATVRALNEYLNEE